MAAAARKQDMPPPGGFKTLNFERVSPKTYFKGPTIIIGFLGITFGSFYLYRITYKQIQRDTIELRSSMLAITPLLLAERDREYMKQLRRNRDEEAKLMANVEGWEVGTLYGQPVFKTIPRDTLVEPTLSDYYVHANPAEQHKFFSFKFWS